MPANSRWDLIRRLRVNTNVLQNVFINPLNAELHPICHLLALLGAHPILHVSRIRVNYCSDMFRLQLLAFFKELICFFMCAAYKSTYLAEFYIDD